VEVKKISQAEKSIIIINNQRTREKLFSKEPSRHLSLSLLLSSLEHRLLYAGDIDAFSPFLFFSSNPTPFGITNFT
jgi:hypothetical protein